MAAPPPAARAGVDDLTGHVRGRVRRLLGGRGGRMDQPRLPDLLPVRRHPQRAVARPRHRVPAGRAPAGRWRPVGLGAGVRLRRRGDGHDDHAGRPARGRAARGPRAVRASPPHPGRRRLRRGGLRHRRRRAVVGLAPRAGPRCRSRSEAATPLHRDGWPSATSSSRRERSFCRPAAPWPDDSARTRPSR